MPAKILLTSHYLLTLFVINKDPIGNKPYGFNGSSLG